MNARATPSLRIAKLSIENFRTFREPTSILLSSKEGADAMPVFHGGNGSGKSNALAAIELFFRAASFWLGARQGGTVQTMPLQLSWSVRDSRTGFYVSHRSWPPGVRAPQTISITFADPALAPVIISVVPSGNEVLLQLNWDSTVKPERAKDYIWLKDALEVPLGSGSVPFFRLDARRREFSTDRDTDTPDGPLSDSMAERLLAMATSFEPGETERWRSFVSLISRFKTLSGREISVVRTGSQGADLRFEIRGPQILQISELSSGEQQVIALTAAVLTSRAAIVAIEEPEISLHPDNQQLVRDVLREQVASGIVDQIILESHVPIFDGPEVLRFNRSAEGVTSVTRQPAGAGDQLRARAKEGGAEEEWVTPEGYTQLPEEMRRELELDQGGYLWFLRSNPDGRWQAWKASDLDRMFGWGDSGSKDK